MRATWICNVEIFFFLSVSVCTLNAATCYIHSIPVATAEQSLRLVFALGVSVQTHVLPLHQVLHLPVRRDASRQDPHRLPSPPVPGNCPVPASDYHPTSSTSTTTAASATAASSPSASPSSTGANPAAHAGLVRGNIT